MPGVWDNFMLKDKELIRVYVCISTLLWFRNRTGSIFFYSNGISYENIIDIIAWWNKDNNKHISARISAWSLESIIYI